MRKLQHLLGGAAALATLAAFIVLGVGPSAADGGTPATLHADHIGATNPGFSKGSCPSSSYGSWGWHFVLPGNDTTFVSISVTFEHEGTVTSFISHPTGKHAYVYTHQADKLLSATAMVDGPQTWFNLSHVCTGTYESTTTTSPTTTEGPTTTYGPTTTEEPTTTYGPTTTKSHEEPSTTATKNDGDPTTTAAQAESAAVLGAVEQAPAPAPTQLAFTGAHTVEMLFAAAGLLALGSVLTAAARRGVLAGTDA
jgi:hypothetical protein